VRKAAVLSPYIVIVIFNQLNIKKNKSINNFEKNHNKKNYVGKYCSSSQCFKEKKL